MDGLGRDAAEKVAVSWGESGRGKIAVLFLGG